MASDNQQDLPLPSLQSDFVARHYLLDLDCQVERRTFEGAVYIFLQHSDGRGDKLILDAKDLNIHSVHKVKGTLEEVNTFLEDVERKQCLDSFQRWSQLEKEKELKFRQSEWSLDIDLEGSHLMSCLVVQIQFSTRPHSSSNLWTQDDDGQMCVWTTGQLINNRSFFPHQDAPALFATWQAVLRVPEGYTPLTTGDKPSITAGDSNSHYFYTSMQLPMSTFGLMVGKFLCTDVPLRFDDEFLPDDRLVECRHVPYPCPFARPDRIGPAITPCRIFSCPSVDVTCLAEYLPGCLKVIHSILGRHVVSKLDLVVTPSVMTCLAFTSPGLILLSPSLMHGQAKMLQRVGHEVSHLWFGVNIGPKDWNEEWISEGFATFMEDVIELKLSGKDGPSRMQLKALNRYQILLSDCRNVDPSLHRMSSSAEAPTGVVSNGLHLDHTVSQIPYLKGYFFLVQLAGMVGLDELLLAVKSFVESFHGCLVSTEDVVGFFRNRFIRKKEEIDQLARSWLHQTILPLLKLPVPLQVAQHFDYWQRRLRNEPPDVFPPNPADHTVSLLDQLLDCQPVMKPRIVEKVINHYRPETLNAEAYHRGCELIVASRCARLLPLVRQFLVQHPAMGAYLYGELMLTDLPAFQAVAVESFRFLEDRLDSDFKNVVRDLIYPK